MPFCPQCGVENPDTARFCDQCGATLIPVSVQPPATGQTIKAPEPSALPAAVAGPASAGPSSCPQCGAAVIPGEAFCDNCGASLLAVAPPAPPPPAAVFPSSSPQPTYPPPQPVNVPPVNVPPPVAPPQPVNVPPPPVAPPQPVNVPPPPVAVRTQLAPSWLELVDGTRIDLPAAVEAVIGRADPVSGFFPAVDLGPHGALDHGVGRRHLALRVSNGIVYAEDLDSTNGSSLNGKPLATRSPEPLADGAELRVGKLLLYFRQK